MRSQQNIKICDAKQAKQVYQYKNTKIKLYKNNAAIWYNKTCRIKQLIPTCVNIRVNSNNPRYQRTKNAAIRYRTDQELKFQYTKKQQLSEQLYKIQLECATLWPTTWQLNQSTIDSKIQQQMEEHCKKLDHLLQKQLKQSISPRHNNDNDKHQFYTRVKNLTNVRLNKEEMQLLKYGLNYSIERPVSSCIANLTAETERAIRLLDVKTHNTYRIMATSKLKQIINSNSQNNVLQKRQLHVMKELNKKLTTENAIITQADKDKTIVIINSNEYSEKVHSFLTANNFNILTKDPTEKFHNLIHKTMQKSNLIIDKK